jgi:ABC-type multidrug transport system fused ATPase/permease subunit
LSDFRLAYAALESTPWRFVLPASIASVAVVWLNFARARTLGTILDQLGAAPLLLQSAGVDTPAVERGGLLRGVAATFGGSGDFWRSIALLAGLAVVDWVACTLRDFLFERARASRLLSSRVQYLSAMMRQDLAFHDAHKSSDLAQRLSSDPEAMDDFTIYALDRLLRGLSALVTLAYMLASDWQMMVLGVALRLPFILQLVEASVRIVGSYERLLRETAMKAQSRATETLANVRVIQASTAEEAEVRGYALLLLEYLHMFASSAAVMAVFRHTERVILALNDLAALAFGAYRIWSGRLSLGRFTSYRSHIDTFTDQFRELEALYKSLRKATAQSRRYYGLLQREPAIPSLLATPTEAQLEAELASDSSAGGDAGDVCPALPPQQPAVRLERAAETGAAADGVSTAVASAGAVLRMRRRLASKSPARQRVQAEQLAAGLPTLQSPPMKALARRVAAFSTGAAGPASEAPASPPSASARHIRGDVALHHVYFSYQAPPPAADGRSASTAGAGPAAGTLPGEGGFGADAGAAVASTSGAQQWTLQDVDFAVKAGTRVALVGTSGSGKTTLVRLLMRFFDPLRGSVTLDGHPLAAFSARALRSAVAMVDQDTALMDRSVLENLLLGCSPAQIRRISEEARRRGLAGSENRSGAGGGGGESDDDTGSVSTAHSGSACSIAASVRSTRTHAGTAASSSGLFACPSLDQVVGAAKRAHCHEFIAALPQGYCTPLGERGGRLSGGQRQRIVVLRAILRDPAVLVLDEVRRGREKWRGRQREERPRAGDGRWRNDGLWAREAFEPACTGHTLILPCRCTSSGCFLSALHPRTPVTLSCLSARLPATIHPLSLHWLAASSPPRRRPRRSTRSRRLPSTQRLST